MTYGERLFPVPSSDTLLLVVRPDEGGYWTVQVHSGTNPLQDGDPSRYDRLTAGEVLDVLDATLVGHLGLA